MMSPIPQTFVTRHGHDSLFLFDMIINCLDVIPGTIIAGLFALCCGKTRFSEDDPWDYKLFAFLVNLIVGALQFFTILLCLVGWCWSIGWGITMIVLASRFLFTKLSFSHFYMILMVNLKQPSSCLSLVPGVVPKTFHLRLKLPWNGTSLALETVFILF